MKNTIHRGSRVAALALLLGWAMAPTGRAQTNLAGPADADDKVTVITSDRLTYDYAKHYALFEQNVVVTDPQLKILADRLMVIFDEGGKAKSVKAEGQVYLIQADKKAKAETAVYDVSTGEIVLTGRPQVSRGRDTLTGDKITFWRNENRMKCEPKARLVIYPDSDSRSVLGGPMP
jgi:lipopolysaccharide export system protein LptA